MSIKTTYSHAAPYIREKVLRAAALAANADTERERRKYFERMTAYVTSLDILLHSPEGVNSPDGIDDFEAIPSGWEHILRGYLNGHTELFPTLAEQLAPIKVGQEDVDGDAT